MPERMDKDEGASRPTELVESSPGPTECEVARLASTVGWSLGVAARGFMDGLDRIVGLARPRPAKRKRRPPPPEPIEPAAEGEPQAAESALEAEADGEPARSNALERAEAKDATKTEAKVATETEAEAEAFEDPFAGVLEADEAEEASEASTEGETEKGKGKGREKRGKDTD